MSGYQKPSERGCSEYGIEKRFPLYGCRENELIFNYAEEKGTDTDMDVY